MLVQPRPTEVVKTRQKQAKVLDKGRLAPLPRAIACMEAPYVDILQLQSALRLPESHARFWLKKGHEVCQSFGAVGAFGATSVMQTWVCMMTWNAMFWP